MPAVCESLGVRFDYPENWTVDDSAAEGEGGQVVVAGPETAMWQLSRYGRYAELEPLFDEALAAFRKEYRELEVSPASETVEGFELEGYDIEFIYLDLTVTIWLRGFRTPRGTFVLVCQAEDRELARVAPVFKAMLASLLRNER